MGSPLSPLGEGRLALSSSERRSHWPRVVWPETGLHVTRLRQAVHCPQTGHSDRPLYVARRKQLKADRSGLSRRQQSLRGALKRKIGQCGKKDSQGPTKPKATSWPSAVKDPTLQGPERPARGFGPVFYPPLSCWTPPRAVSQRPGSEDSGYETQMWLLKALGSNPASAACQLVTETRDFTSLSLCFPLKEREG